jgi:hypothetical protein
MVAETILRQLGGRRFAVMTGSKNFIDGGDSLSMKLTRNQSGANYLRITLTPADEYKMEFIKANAKGMKTIKELEGVYCDQLQNIFTDVTGMYTRL